MGEDHRYPQHDFDGEKGEDKILFLSRVIKETQNHYSREKKGALYKFLFEVIERSIIEDALLQAEGNQLMAARILGLNRNTIHSKIIKLKINPEDFKDYRKSK
ncbi:MAG: helix-turn-helix domain-containing protein [Candidatus Omnitrophota bacterium]|jgi:DNA-binding protein Fis